MGDCKLCIHTQVCELWRINECQDASCFGNPSSDGCDYFAGWIDVDDKKPDEFVSVLGHMTDAGDFPAVRECYMVGGAFFFPALCDVHPVDKWMPMPKEE